MENNLTYDELDILIDAVEKWEQDSDIGEALMGAVFGSMIDDPEAKEEFEKEREKKQQKREVEKRERKRKGAILKAKLYEMQDEEIKSY